MLLIILSCIAPKQDEEEGKKSLTPWAVRKKRKPEGQGQYQEEEKTKVEGAGEIEQGTISTCLVVPVCDTEIELNIPDISITLLLDS